MMTKPTMVENPAFVIRDATGEAVLWAHALLWPADFGYPMWSQRDPEWSGEQLGFGPTTIGQYGCLITSIAMALTNLKDERISPAHVNNEMKRMNAYSGSNRNRLDLTAVSRAWPTMQFIEKRAYPRTPAPTEEMANWVRLGDIVIIQIDMDLSDADVDEHWLLVTAMEPDGSKLKYHDPWTKPDAQEVFTMPPGYCKKGWTPARAITAHVRYGVIK